MPNPAKLRPPAPTFFATPAAFRAWLERHHEDRDELIVGFYKKRSGKPSMTWPEAVDEALCFGWIDGVRHSLDDASYTNRFTPRRPQSNWSAINVARVEELTLQGRMAPAGIAAFERRSDVKTGTYSYEQRHDATLTRAGERRFRAQRTAWSWFQAQPPSYRTSAIWWVVSAKKPGTRERRLTRLIEDSAAGRTIPPLTRPNPGS